MLIIITITNKPMKLKKLKTMNNKLAESTIYQTKIQFQIKSSNMNSNISFNNSYITLSIHIIKQMTLIGMAY